MNPRRHRAYYNEIEPFAAAWLGNLSRAGHINRGRVDTRSITDLEPSDVQSATQAHFFAGIGAWSYALRLAGWPDDRPVWTGSCPCQPFSTAGAGKGFDDERHLWPEWFRLIRVCRPPVVFGEQVAGTAGYQWLDVVLADLEGAGYAVGAAVLPAASVGAPHSRHRIFFGAVRLGDDDAGGPSGGGLPGLREGVGVTGAQPAGAGADGPWPRADWIPCRDGKHRPVEPGTFPLAHGAPARVGRLRGYGNAIVPQVAAAFVTSFMEALS